MCKRSNRRTFFGCCSTAHKLKLRLASCTLPVHWVVYGLSDTIWLGHLLDLRPIKFVDDVNPRQRLRKKPTQLISQSVLARSQRQFPWNSTLSKRPSCLNYATVVRMLSMITCFDTLALHYFREKFVALYLIKSDFLGSLASLAGRLDLTSSRLINT